MSSDRWDAMESPGRSEGKEANAKLTELLADKSTMYDNVGNKDAGHQVRDCALAALVHGRGKKEEDYGFGGSTRPRPLGLAGYALVLWFSQSLSELSRWHAARRRLETRPDL
jgi:hypothetical protein